MFTNTQCAGLEAYLHLHHGLVAKGNRVAINDLLAKGETGNRNHLDIRDSKRNTNDGERLPHCSGQMSQCEPEPRDEEPNHVTHAGEGVGTARRLHHSPTKWPQRVLSHPEASDARGDRHDENTRDGAKEYVSESQPDTTSNKPEKIKYKPHSPHLNQF